MPIVVKMVQKQACDRSYYRRWFLHSLLMSSDYICKFILDKKQSHDSGRVQRLPVNVSNVTLNRWRAHEANIDEDDFLIVNLEHYQ